MYLKQISCLEKTLEISYIYSSVIKVSIPILLPFTLIRRHLPIIVLYVMTINKSHGQSLEIFNHSRLYIVISRLQSKNGLKILINDNDDKPLKTTTNVVYKEVQYHFITQHLYINNEILTNRLL
ncbi:hypothetical protein Lal_00043104 [Lupinus albus]|nr:hypothetical protein Lal_00043104 [Lupinus albus]